MKRSDIYIYYPCVILEMLNKIIEVYSIKWIKYLPVIIEIILACLNPEFPSTRIACKKNAYLTLYVVI